jgi:anaerobic selenocysteine-containing dehydrogenase
MPGATRHYRTCPLCEATCGLELTVEDGRVVRTRGDAEDVFSAGFLCPKGTTLGALHEDPDRLRQPHVKKGGVHVPVSWDEAFGRVAEGLGRVREEHGNEAVGIYLGNPNVHNLAGSLYVSPLIRALRTRAVFSASTVDQMPRHVSCGHMYGNAGTIPVPDIDRTDYLLMLGANPFESNGSLATAPDWPGRMRRIRERGGKVVVVDPRRTRTAEAADEHLAILPGTDTHFLLALAHVIVAEGLADLGAAAPHVAGFDAACAAVRAFTPALAAARTGIAADDIVRIARELAAAPSAAVYGRIGAHTTRFGTLASWAADLVTVLTGNLDRPGGIGFPLAAHARPRRAGPGKGFRAGRWTSRVRGLPEIRGELPVATLADEIETAGAGQVRALVTIAGNPVISTPNGGGRLDAALAGLEFMVSVDPYLNETTRHADVVLPPPSVLERSHFDLAFLGIAVRNVANYSPPLFAAGGPSEADILARLTLIASGREADAKPDDLHQLLLRGLVSAEVGKEHSPIAGRDPDEIVAAVAGRPPEEQLLDVMLRTGSYGDGFGARPGGLSLARLEAHPHGIDLGALEPGLPDVLSTPSGKVELLPEAIAADLARLEADLEAAPADEPFQLFQLIGRRTVRSCNSWMHNVPVLVRGRDRCTLHLHPDDAARLGVTDGARVRVTSRVGSLEVAAELTDAIRPGVVSLPHGYGHDLPGVRASVAAKQPGVNSNWLTDPEPLDPLSGNAVLNGIPVEVEAAGAPA